MRLDWPRLSAFRLRILFRVAFLLLAASTVLLALFLLREEKQLSYQEYRSSLTKTAEQIAARLRHPSGQLALLNPNAFNAALIPLHPVVLPFSAIDFDDQNKVQQAIEMAGCLIHFGQDGSLCVAIGNKARAGGFIYVVGRFSSQSLQPHVHRDQRLDGAHRVHVSVSLRGQQLNWMAPFETMEDGDPSHGRLTGFVERTGDYEFARPVRDFRGWLWQSKYCDDVSAKDQKVCPRSAFFSVRLPVVLLTDTGVDNQAPVWPPVDLDRINVHVEVLPPGNGPALLDSNRPGATPPFALVDLKSLLSPGEKLTIRKLGVNGQATDLINEIGLSDDKEKVSRLVGYVIRHLDVDGYDKSISLRQEIVTGIGSYEVLLNGDVRSINRTLAVVTTRVSWFVGAMLLAVMLAWLVIEIGIIRRIGELTRRAETASRTMKDAGGLEPLKLSDLRSGDELGILAGCLADLMQRVREDAQREKIRAEQEKDRWHAVGHEIMSPLQSLMALHDADESTRYIKRMQQAIRILYGSASPSEGFESTTLQIEKIDLNAFLQNVAQNAPCAGISNVTYENKTLAIWVRADEYSLEDVVTHVLRNADRYRLTGSPISIELAVDESQATVTLHNQGPAIPVEMLGRIFEYGVSDQEESGANGNRGQGLFVAKTYMAKMGGKIVARNVSDGVQFELRLVLAS